MPDYVKDLIEVTEVDEETFIHVVPLVDGVRKDRKISFSNLQLSLGVVSGGGGNFDPDITSFEMLEALITVGSEADAVVGDVKEFIVSSSFYRFQLQESIAATDGVFARRPDDYADQTTHLVWISVG